jgi:NAD(P)-dependent dehydrogenase (short-subunit alcohol dehydrogenase family)
MTSTPDAFDLTGRRALVSGASRGIGQAIAVEFARRGAEVLVAARSDAGLADTVALSNGCPGSITPLSADLRSEESIQQVVDQAAALLGGLDILVNNAADDHDSSIEDTDLATWQRVMELNLQSCFLMCRSASEHLAANGRGKVINVASVLGTVAIQNDIAYVSAKHGLIGMTRALSLEWARRGVQVNALAPGWVETSMTAAAFADDGIAKWIKRGTPMGRWATVDEMTGPAVFLASDASNFMTGQVLVIDGGWTVQ